MQRKKTDLYKNVRAHPETEDNLLSARRESYGLKAPSKYTAKSQQRSFDITKLEQANREFFGSLKTCHI
jgi:hypothetical protein